LERPIAIACLGLFVLSSPFFIRCISFFTICFAFGPYLREVPEPERWEREVRVRAVVAFDERAFVDRVERGLEVDLRGERATEVLRRLPALAPARRVREREVEAVVARDDLVRGRGVAYAELRLLARVDDPRAGRELDLRLLVAMV
jgi:hypothetical protein